MLIKVPAGFSPSALHGVKIPLPPAGAVSLDEGHHAVHALDAHYLDRVRLLPCTGSHGELEGGSALTFAHGGLQVMERVDDASEKQLRKIRKRVVADITPAARVPPAPMALGRKLPAGATVAKRSKKEKKEHKKSKKKKSKK